MRNTRITFRLKDEFSFRMSWTSLGLFVTLAKRLCEVCCAVVVEGRTQDEAFNFDF